MNKKKEMTGFEVVFKYAPIAGAVLIAAMGYGELSSTVKHLESTQSIQFQLIESQLAAINANLSGNHK